MKAAEKECLDDSDARERQRERNKGKRENLDCQYVDRFARKIRELYSQCPVGSDITIAEHACLKYSGRVGRCAKAKEYDRWEERHEVEKGIIVYAGNKIFQVATGIYAVPWFAL